MTPEALSGSGREKPAKKEISLVLPLVEIKKAQVESLVNKLVGTAEKTEAKAKLLAKLATTNEKIVEHRDSPGSLIEQFIFVANTMVDLYSVEVMVRKLENKIPQADILEKVQKNIGKISERLENVQDKGVDAEPELVSQFTQALSESEKDFNNPREKKADRHFEERLKKVADKAEELVEKKKVESTTTKASTDDEEAVPPEDSSDDAVKKKADEARRRVKASEANSFRNKNEVNKVMQDYLDECKEKGVEPDPQEIQNRIMSGLYEAKNGMSKREYENILKENGGQLTDAQRIAILMSDEDAEFQFEKFFRRAYAQQSENFYKTLSFRDQIDLIDFFDTFTSEKAIRAAVEKFNANPDNKVKATFESMQKESRLRLNRFSKEYVARANLFNGHMGIENGWIQPADFYKAMGPMTSELWGYIFPEGDSAKASFALSLYENTFTGSLDLKNRVEWEDVGVNRVGGGKAESKFDEKIRGQFESFTREEVKKKLGFKGKLSTEQEKSLTAEMQKFWPDWKITKALALAKSFFIVNLRAPEIVAKGTFDRDNQFVSQPYEDYTRALDNYEWFGQKYWVGGGAGIMLYYLFGSREDENGKKRSMSDMYTAWRSGEIRKDAEYMKNMRNIFGIGGHMTETGWRGPRMAEDILTQHTNLAPLLGINIRLQGMRLQMPDHLKHGGGHGHENPAKKTWEENKRKEIWTDALWMNPMAVIHEAQTLYGYSVDYAGGLWKKVYDKMGVGEKEVIQAREDLSFVQATSLAMVDVSRENMAGFPPIKKEDFLNFNLIEDEGRRKNAEKLFASIRSVAEEKIQWQVDRDGVKRKDVTQGKAYDGVIDFLSKRSGEYLKQGLSQNDVRQDLLAWEKTGHVGWVRRLRDFSGAVGIQHTLPKFFDQYGMFRNPVEIAAYLTKEVLPNMRSYDGDKSALFAEKLSMAICEFHQEPKSWRYLPQPIPVILDYAPKFYQESHDVLMDSKLIPQFVKDKVLNSKLLKPRGLADNMSEEVLGEEGMIWSSASKRDFINHMRLYQAYGGGHAAHEIESRLFKNTSSRLSDVAKEAFAKYWLFGVGVFGGALIKELVNMIEQDTAGGGSSGGKKSAHH